MEREFIKSIKTLKCSITTIITDLQHAKLYIRTRLIHDFVFIKFNKHGNLTLTYLYNSTDKQCIISELRNDGTVKLKIIVGGGR